MLVLRLFFMAIVFVPTVTYSEDRPYFWGTDLSEDYSYVEFGYSTKKTNSETVMGQYVAGKLSLTNGRTWHDTTEGRFKYTSARSDDLIVSLERDERQSNPGGTYKTTKLGFDFQKKTSDLTLRFKLTNSHSTIQPSWRWFNFSIVHEPNDFWTYSASVSLVDGFNVPRVNGKMNGSISAVYDNDTGAYDSRLAVSGSRGLTVRTGTSSWSGSRHWRTYTQAEGHTLKKLAKFKIGAGFKGIFYSSQTWHSNSLDLKLMSVYSTDNYEVSANLVRSKIRRADTSYYFNQDRIGNSIELAYRKAFNDGWFINLTADHSVSRDLSNAKSSSLFYRTRYENNNWNISITKRF